MATPARTPCLPPGVPMGSSQLLTVLQWRAQICLSRWGGFLFQRCGASRSTLFTERPCGHSWPECVEFRGAASLQSRPRTRPPRSRYQSSPGLPTSTSVSLSVTSVLFVPACIACPSVCRASSFRSGVCRLCLQSVPLTVGAQRASPVSTENGWQFFDYAVQPIRYSAVLGFWGV